jgi:2'-5' RNA ligase
MPQSIVIAIDDPYREWLEGAAGEIKAVTGRKDLVAATRPHATLHVAGRYGDGIDAALAHVATHAAGLTLDTREVGVFRGPQTVVALEVVRTDALLAFHRTLIGVIAPLSDDPKAVYATGSWAPHISIVAGRIEPEHTDAITALLARRDFAWRMPVTNVCLVPSPRATEWVRFDVAG